MMLRSSPRFDYKWIKCDIQVRATRNATQCVLNNIPTQAAFTEEGLAKLWNEIVKDGEIGDAQEEKNDSEAASPRHLFQQLVQEWSWGSEPGPEQFEKAIQKLTLEQYNMLSQESCQTQYLLRLKQRLAIMERYFFSLARKGIGGHRHGTLNTTACISKKKEISSPAAL